MTIVRVIDVESTGPSPDGDEHGLVEIGYADVVARATDLAGDPCDWHVVEGRARLLNPGVPIPAETSAVHHLVDEDVADAAPWKGVMKGFIRQARADGVVAFGAHSSSMEEMWFHPSWWGDEPPIPFICSYKSALRHWPDAPGHGNQCLRYWLKHSGLDRDKASPAHRAGPDAYVTAFHFAALLNDGVTIDRMLGWTAEPALTVRCYVGDTYRNGGKGTPWAEVETSMLEWIVGKGFEDKPDVRFTAEYHLNRRRAELAAAAEAEAERDPRQLEFDFA